MTPVTTLTIPPHVHGTLLCERGRRGERRRIDAQAAKSVGRVVVKGGSDPSARVQLTTHS